MQTPFQTREVLLFPVAPYTDFYFLTSLSVQLKTRQKYDCFSMTASNHLLLGRQAFQLGVNYFSALWNRC